MVPGVLVLAGVLDGACRFLVVPALTLRQVKEHRDSLKAILELVKTGSWTSLTDEQIDEVAAAVMLTAVRNHPMIDKERLIDLLDTNTAVTAIAGLLGQGKFVTPQPGDEQFFVENNEPLAINALYSRPLQA